MSSTRFSFRSRERERHLHANPLRVLVDQFVLDERKREHPTRRRKIRVTLSPHYVVASASRYCRLRETLQLSPLGTVLFPEEQSSQVFPASLFPSWQAFDPSDMPYGY